jgi:hypothetical protein
MSNPILGLTSDEVSKVVRTKLLKIISDLDETFLCGLSQRFDETDSAEQAHNDAVEFLADGDLCSAIIMSVVSDLFPDQ